MVKKKIKLSNRQKKYRKYLNSKEWEEIRVELHIVRGSKCERCSSKKNLQVHHLTYDNIFNEELEDLELLCAGCHKSEHRPIKKKKRQISFQKKCKMLESKEGRKRLKKLKYKF